MSQVDLNRLNEEPWGTFIKQIRADVNEGKHPKVLLCGSIFGGTGASGLPTLARLIANKLTESNIRERVLRSVLFLSCLILALLLQPEKVKTAFMLSQTSFCSIQKQHCVTMSPKPKAFLILSTYWVTRKCDRNY
jgi:hypothetical protein